MKNQINLSFSECQKRLHRGRRLDEWESPTKE